MNWKEVWKRTAIGGFTCLALVVAMAATAWTLDFINRSGLTKYLVAAAIGGAVLVFFYVVGYVLTACAEPPGSPEPVTPRKPRY